MQFAEEFTARRLNAYAEAEQAREIELRRVIAERKALAKEQRTTAPQGTSQRRCRRRARSVSGTRDGDRRDDSGVGAAGSRRLGRRRAGAAGRFRGAQGAPRDGPVTAIPPSAKGVKKPPSNVGGSWHDEAMRSPAASPSMIGREPDLEMLRDELAESRRGRRGPSSRWRGRHRQDPPARRVPRRGRRFGARPHRPKRRPRHRRRAVRSVHRHPPAAGRRDRTRRACSTAAGPSSGVLSVLLPELGSIEGVPARTGVERLYELVTVLLENVSRERPLVVLIEDIHWADAATLELVRFLIRMIARRPVPDRAQLPQRRGAARASAALLPARARAHPARHPLGARATRPRPGRRPVRADPRLPARSDDRRPRLPVERGRSVLRRRTHRHRPSRHRRRPARDPPRAAARSLRAAQRADAARAAAHLRRRGAASITNFSPPSSTARPRSSTRLRAKP